MQMAAFPGTGLLFPLDDKQACFVFLSNRLQLHSSHNKKNIRRRDVHTVSLYKSRPRLPGLEDTGWLTLLLSSDRAPFCVWHPGGWAEKETHEEGRLAGKERVWACQAEDTTKSMPRRAAEGLAGLGRGHRPM